MLTAPPYPEARPLQPSAIAAYREAHDWTVRAEQHVLMRLRVWGRILHWSKCSVLVRAGKAPWHTST